MQMEEAGLPPGPRAYHAVVFAHVRAKQPYEALEVAKATVERGKRNIRTGLFLGSSYTVTSLVKLRAKLQRLSSTGRKSDIGPPWRGV